ncbi:MAG TPA: lamin tail domain-containing protein, partial [Prolixibacteraceae bacterium]|nr:lamin tail domain-containing protein [Prolixibacteraceae bacterium]
WLHEKLAQNKEYRMKFADRVYRHFFNTGVFTPDSCIARFNQTATQLNLAVIAESARWGDSGNWPARTKIDDWLPAIKSVTNDFMPYRTEIVFNQLKDAGLYPDLKPPVFKENGTEIISNKIILTGNFSFELENQNPGGSIFYTVDGQDPRGTGGTILGAAINAGNIKSITVMPGNHVMARVKNGSEWSALHEITFEDSGLFSNLKITELHYHPADQGETDDKELEFLELKNIGANPLDLSGLAFTDGITFTFPEGTTIQPGAFVVLASNMEEFAKLYGFAADFGYSGSLANEGERVVLETATNEEVIAFTFSDDEPWPLEADGDGYSLVSAEDNPLGDPNLAEYWTTSKEINGSPMSDDLNSITTSAPFITSNSFEWNIYPNPAASFINIDFLLATDETIEIGLYDFNGRFLQVLAREKLPAGEHNRGIQLNRLNINSGMYLVTFRSGSHFATKKLVYYQK